MGPEEAIRLRMFKAGLRTVLNVAKRWDLTEQQVCSILSVSPATLGAWQLGNSEQITDENLLRVSLILGIYRRLAELFPISKTADAWVQQPNKAVPFCGESAIAFILKHDAEITILRAVRDYLVTQVGD